MLKAIAIMWIVFGLIMLGIPVRYSTDNIANVLIGIGITVVAFMLGISWEDYPPRS
jgi:hypothetical protein